MRRSTDQEVYDIPNLVTTIAVGTVQGREAPVVGGSGRRSDADPT